MPSIITPMCVICHGSVSGRTFARLRTGLLNRSPGAAGNSRRPALNSSRDRSFRSDMIANRHGKRQLARERTRVAIARAPSLVRSDGGTARPARRGPAEFRRPDPHSYASGLWHSDNIHHHRSQEYRSVFRAIRHSRRGITARKVSDHRRPFELPALPGVRPFGPIRPECRSAGSPPASVSVHSSFFSEALPSFFAVSHNWHGRAPPPRSAGS